MDKAGVLPPDPVAGLIDMPLPPSISLWPQTLAARAVCIAVLIAFALAVGRWLYLWHVNRYRRVALADLERIAQESPDTAVSQLALLVRRTALAVFPRQKIARLSGEAWLAFLDQSYGGHEFSRGIGRVLSRGPYEPPQDASAPGLSDLVRRWISVHHV
jgi:Ca-activated chloride channel family protein